MIKFILQKNASIFAILLIAIVGYKKQNLLFILYSKNIKATSFWKKIQFLKKLKNIYKIVVLFVHSGFFIFGWQHSFFPLTIFVLILLAHTFSILKLKVFISISLEISFLFLVLQHYFYYGLYVLCVITHRPIVFKKKWIELVIKEVCDFFQFEYLIKKEFLISLKI